ncbi:MAG: hypothetical protein ACRD2J_04790 [Thermoanaerobaculia bacterium]
MSAILIRFGLYTILLMLALFILNEQVELPRAELITNELLAQMGFAGFGLVVLGAITAVFEKTQKKGRKGRCVICKKPILVGDMYCREHLRQVIADEQDRIHATMRR